MKLLRTSLFLLLAVSLPGAVRAQDIHPRVQALINDLTTWMSESAARGEALDPAELERRNARIREVQDSVSRAAAQPPSEPYSIGAPVLKTTRITRTVMAGSSLTVPENCEWRVVGMYVKNDLDGYRIKVTSVPLKEAYFTGDVITAPVMSSESALLSGDSMSATYDFEIDETRFD